MIQTRRQFAGGVAAIPLAVIMAGVPIEAMASVAKISPSITDPDFRHAYRVALSMYDGMEEWRAEHRAIANRYSDKRLALLNEWNAGGRVEADYPHCKQLPLDFPPKPEWTKPLPVKTGDDLYWCEPYKVPVLVEYDGDINDAIAVLLAKKGMS